MKNIFLLLLIALIAAAGWFGWQHKDAIPLQSIPGFEKESNLLTFETSTSFDELMQKHQKELLKTAGHTFGKTTTRYLPCLLFHVKYTKDNKKTEEGKLLFNLENGEMVIDTRSFEMTHGFEDCLAAHADEEDFRLLHVLHLKGGSISKEALAHELGMQAERLFQRLDSLRKKHLVAIHGDMVRIHLPTPLLKVHPETDIHHAIVTKMALKEGRLSPHYNKGAIKHLVKSAFGPDFAIRREEMIYVPILQIDVQNPDGSIMSSYWNGLTGKRTSLKY